MSLLCLRSKTTPSAMNSKSSGRSSRGLRRSKRWKCLNRRDSTGLPTWRRFSRPYTGGAASVADIRQLQAPVHSGIDIESYQLDPVVRAIQMPLVNLLMADDVGLGKTIEAGMAVLELMMLQPANRVLLPPLHDFLGH